MKKGGCEKEKKEHWKEKGLVIWLYKNWDKKKQLEIFYLKNNNSWTVKNF